MGYKLLINKLGGMRANKSSTTRRIVDVLFPKNLRVNHGGGVKMEDMNISLFTELEVLRAVALPGLGSSPTPEAEHLP